MDYHGFQWTHERDTPWRVAREHEVDPLSALAAQIEELQEKIGMINANRAIQMQSPFMGDEEHYESHLQNTNYNNWESMDYEYDFYELPNYYFSQVDSPSWSNHPTFGWRQEEEGYQTMNWFPNASSPGFTQQTQQETKPSTEDLLVQLVQTQTQFLNFQGQVNKSIKASIMNLEVQLDNITQALNARPIGNLLVDTQNDSEDQPKEIDNVVTLKSDKQLPEVVNPKNPIEENETQESKKPEIKIREVETNLEKEQPSNLDESMYFVKEVITIHSSQENTRTIGQVVEINASESFFLEETKSGFHRKHKSSQAQQTRKNLKFLPALKKIKKRWLGQRNFGKLFQCNPG